MLLVRPFKGIIYNKVKVGSLSEVIAPPYDVISPSQQNFYYRIHPYNIIRVILGKEREGDSLRENKYTRAAKFFRKWLSRGILTKENNFSVYTYSQKYQVEGEKIQREGFIAAMRLEEFSSGLVLPHEHTFPEPQQDRFNLMQACKANFSAIFALFSDPAGEIDALYREARPLFGFEGSDGIKHRLSVLHDEGLINKICSAMQEKKVFIADGHHRYLTALKFKQEAKKQSHPSAGVDYVMVYFLNTSSPGVTILPVHRLIGALTLPEIRKLIKGLKNFFYKKPFKDYAQNEREEVITQRLLSRIKEAGRYTFGMYTREEGYFLLVPRDPQFFPGKIKSAILDELVKDLVGKKSLNKGEEIDFTTSGAHAVREVQNERFQVVFFLIPTTVEEIKKVAFAGGKMPPKSSYFYPKLPSGLVMRDLEDAV